ncbi:MAG: hypothetical protein H6574_03575 [Lewinellaceae bacterium]|nr:hypothetical protein [Saprospiraceae bacterium]MCB9330139.1 hypothetical protein [Lewinellaceae bacterium]
MLTKSVKDDVFFGLHLLIALSAWFIPFLISWQLTVLIFGVVILQHAVFGRCLGMDTHGVSEEDGSTFYSHVFERMGFQPNKKLVRFVVRKLLYSFLAAVAVLWQYVLGHAPLLF